ncbi:hypothetical protein FW774_16355 [Pedobacter sp. BS3]|uniref:ADP-ribosylglycohydrolase family protein n=1 Tax=Pedobacter sp. BS3 TaxID=2567937 RepID=UPI0011EEFF84|nr:ADP-ribosylglycohydrolase family protein [Pedobacter sp. BS3]TZF82256.1 hypothetical protein FW774_16355 [Pedobacter sp. BS3]
MIRSFCLWALLVFPLQAVFPQATLKSGRSSTVKELTVSGAQYRDRVQAVWIAQMAAAIMGFPFEHKTASVKWIGDYTKPLAAAMVDDDWYYEMVAIRAFEKYGINMSVQQLGKQWLENSCGTWGSSEQARLLMQRGVDPAETGHPRYNKLWFSIGPQFSADVYGALAPAMPNVAAVMARKYGHINGYAEGADGAVFIAGMVSLGFSEKDPQTIVRKAARLIHPSSPYRKCIDLVIRLADAGKPAAEIFNAVEDRWHIEYPATNNAVANGGIVAASLWFGKGDFLKTVNLAFGAADFTDADCNAANAAAVIGAMQGMKGIPANLVDGLHDRVKGEKMGSLVLTPAVDESISGLAERTAAIGIKILQQHGAKFSGKQLSIPVQEPVTQPAELFKLADLMQYWNPDWTLERAGFGGAGGGMGGIRGNTYLDGEVLATYPRDEVKGLLLRRTLKVNGEKALALDVAADPGRVWRLEVYADNEKLLNKLITENEKERQWQHISIGLSQFEGQTIVLRLYQRVLVKGREAGNAYWKSIKIN